MMRGIREKLSADKGASITFALLLFLVCAIISSVVLVAGTSAAGRLSDLSKSEQRYYSVMSAAKLIQDMLESEKATVIHFNGSNYSVKDDNLVLMDSTEGKDLAGLIAARIADHASDSVEFTLDPAGDEDLERAAEDVTITSRITGDDVHFTFKSKDNKYIMELTFSTIESRSTVYVDTGSGSGKGEKTVYSWKLKDM